MVWITTHSFSSVQDDVHFVNYGPIQCKVDDKPGYALRQVTCPQVLCQISIVPTSTLSSKYGHFWCQKNKMALAVMSHSWLWKGSPQTTGGVLHLIDPHDIDSGGNFISICFLTRWLDYSTYDCVTFTSYVLRQTCAFFFFFLQLPECSFALVLFFNLVWEIYSYVLSPMTESEFPSLKKLFHELEPSFLTQEKEIGWGSVL